MPLVADYGISSDEDEESSNKAENLANLNSEEVLEDFVKKTNYEGVILENPPPPKSRISKELSNMRLPTAGGKIKISAPVLQDSDSDGDEPTSKKLKVSSGAPGFLGSLPAPRNLPLGSVSDSSTVKQTTQSFIPYSLTKPKDPAPSKQSTASGKKPGKAPAKQLPKPSSDSDDDEEYNTQSKSINFFAMDSEENSSPATRGFADMGGSSFVHEVRKISADQSQQKITAASLYNMSSENSNGESNAQEAEQPYVDEQMDDSGHCSSEPSNNTSFLQDEQFLKLHGKKKKGKEEINFIDVNADDHMATELELTKNLSEEIDPRMYAHRKNNGGPSGQQKRKHQITYLAYQAKERELELKNTWAANRFSRQQTQSKYGF